MSVCRACIGKCLGLGMNFSPFLSGLFSVSVRVICLTSITKASSFLLFVGLSGFRIPCGSILSCSAVYAVLLVLFICLCFRLFLLYMVLFFNVRLEERPSFGSLFRLQGLFLLSIVVDCCCCCCCCGCPFFEYEFRSPVKASSRSVGGCVCRCGCLDVLGSRACFDELCLRLDMLSVCFRF